MGKSHILQNFCLAAGNQLPNSFLPVKKMASATVHQQGRAFYPGSFGLISYAKRALCETRRWHLNRISGIRPSTSEPFRGLHPVLVPGISTHQSSVSHPSLNSTPFITIFLLCFLPYFRLQVNGIPEDKFFYPLRMNGSDFYCK